ncbi:unnamed protein product [Moneuplotes crassus]|uniref:Uncharacterized protein n=1 Tax=Euplotes crassus TaxID=5936 RepID=A0AAD1XWX8_EUPCR|nr:unnamed protein product [Moneuplotes crassus]
MSLCCTQPASQVDITIGDIMPPQKIRTSKNRRKEVPVLDITAQFTYGFIKKPDFLYLVRTNTKEFPRQSRNLDRELIFKLGNSSFAENVGKVYIPLFIDPGEYKVYYCRHIKQKSLKRSRSQPVNDIEVLGISMPFTLNKTNNESNLSISYCSENENIHAPEFNESDETKLQHHLTMNQSNGISSHKCFSPFSSFQKKTIETIPYDSVKGELIHNTINDTLKTSNADSLSLSKSNEKRREINLWRNIQEGSLDNRRENKENIPVKLKPQAKTPIGGKLTNYQLEHLKRVNESRDMKTNQNLNTPEMKLAQQYPKSSNIFTEETSAFVYPLEKTSILSSSSGEPRVEIINNIQSLLPNSDSENLIRRDLNSHSITTPYTNTFFKCSIYSPSNRLYTVDEVNSRISEHELSSQFKFSTKNQDSINMTSSFIIPCTPTPKVGKVMDTKNIRTKTEKYEQKNLRILGEKQPASAKFLFKTMSSGSSGGDFGSPTVPLGAVMFPSGQGLQSSKTLSYQMPKTKVVSGKVINLTPEKPKLTPKKKPGATRNISRGNIKNMLDERRPGLSSLCSPPHKERVTFNPIDRVASPNTPSVSKNTPPTSLRKRTISTASNCTPYSKTQVPKQSIIAKSKASSSTIESPNLGCFSRSRNSPQPKTEQIEAWVNIDRRTVIFEQKTELGKNISQPIHQISWYNHTSVEDIGNAIDEVVEIMQEMQH